MIDRHHRLVGHLSPTNIGQRWPTLDIDGSFTHHVPSAVGELSLLLEDQTRIVDRTSLVIDHRRLQIIDRDYMSSSSTIDANDVSPSLIDQSSVAKRWSSVSIDHRSSSSIIENR